ncbi:bifunctional diguanylate cyclase/phosphodiesterase [Planococcus lenghuensis]|uniref:EAL domain-containing protein n=1 Tax=Planococcus lenghuensis TaxID=2213202 RepID=A0A1Q2L322_9BACL|nr:EAL domain-containing protein [Planococcus lenghuensis]AQQ54282.1 hypothetical protein B0X71_15030 [Planococcus lenghuensis]
MQLQAISNEQQATIEWLRRLGESFHTSFSVVDPHREELPVVYANDAYCAMTGYALEEIVGLPARFLGTENIDQADAADLCRAIRQGEAGTFERMICYKNRRPCWNELTLQPVFGESDVILFTIVAAKDITRRKQAEALVGLQRAMYTGIESGAPLADLLQKICDTVESFFEQGTACSILTVDRDGRFQVGAGNSLPDELLQAVKGQRADGEIGSCGAAYSRKTIVISEDISTDPLWKSLKDMVMGYGFNSCWSLPIFKSEQLVFGSFGIYFSSRHAPSPEELEFISQISPLITLAVNYREQQMEVLRLSYKDPGTDLPNRHFFLDQLQERGVVNSTGFIAFISILEYPDIIDQYGHRAGDTLIRKLGRRLGALHLSAADCTARFSGATLSFYSDVEAAGMDGALKKISEVLTEPLEVADMRLFPTVKVGVVPLAAAVQNIEEWLRSADSALSEAKKQPGEAVVFFDAEWNEHLLQEQKLAQELTPALLREEVRMYLQPKVNLSTGEVIGFEALARWYSAEYGHVSPDVFISAAERTGKIRLLEQQMLNQVLEWLRSRQDRGLCLRQVAVNISADHFFHCTFSEDMKRLVTLAGIRPELIRFELTESIGFTDFDAAIRVFCQLKQDGFACSIDDFGTGYSSLSYLQMLPVSEIKIDRSFILNLEEEGTQAIVRAIIQLAGNLKMTPVAEGIELDAQREFLLDAGCAVGQGYYFYRPLPVEEADEL